MEREDFNSKKIPIIYFYALQPILLWSVTSETEARGLNRDLEKGLR